MHLKTVIDGWWQAVRGILSARGNHFHLSPITYALLFICALSFLTCNLAFAQGGSASLSGTIVDAKGGLVPDAQVSIVNMDTNVTFEGKTNSAGVYNIPFLQPGRYRILVSKQGFKQIDLRDIGLHAQDSVNRNFTLDVGGTSETIIVNAAEGTSQGITVYGEAIVSRPLR